MDSTNYYQKIKEVSPEFNSLQLNEGEQKRLSTLIQYVPGAIESYRKEIAKLKADEFHSEKEKTRMLAEKKAGFLETLTSEFEAVKSRAAAAENTLQEAIKPPKAKDATEKLLEFMKGQEIRSGLEKMPLAKRIEFLINSVQNGEASVLRAIKGQPITGDLVPAETMVRANSEYTKKVAPGLAATVDLAKDDLEQATRIMSLTQVVLGHCK